jgi:hypothetical protein
LFNDFRSAAFQIAVGGRMTGGSTIIVVFFNLKEPRAAITGTDDTPEY